MTRFDRTPVSPTRGGGIPQISWIRDTERGLNCPHFICCGCELPIRPGEQGIAEWLYNHDQTVIVDWRVRHKAYVCEDSAALSRVPRQHWYWDNLEVVLDQLIYNTLGRVPPPSPERAVQKPRRPKRRRSTSTTQAQRWRILQRDEWKCQRCGRTAELDGVTLEVDHMQPVSKGGTNDDANLWTLCHDCNRGKHDRLS